MRALAIFCYRHARLVIVLWLAVLAGATYGAQSAGIDFRDVLALPASDSSTAQDLLADSAGGIGGAQERVVVKTDGVSVVDPSVQARVEPMLAEIARLPHVAAVVSPYSEAGRAQISPGQQVAFATVTLDVKADDLTQEEADNFVATAKAASGGVLKVAVDGAVATRTIGPPNLDDAGFGLLAAAIVLLFTFGSLFSMLVPIVTAVISVGTAIGVVGLMTHVMDVPTVSQEIVILLGLGVGVDYALFVVTRYRQALVGGARQEDALALAAATSGRSVLFAGVTVCVSLLGQFTVGISFLDGIAISSSIAVLMTMFAALTLLPALLKVLGMRILSSSVRRDMSLRHRKVLPEGRRWGALARAVTRRPYLSTLLALLVIGIMTIPVFSLRLGIPDAGLLKEESTSRQSYDMLAEGFGPGFTGPLVVVGRADTPEERAAAEKVHRELATHPDVAQAVPPVVTPTKQGGQITAVIVYPKASPQDEATSALVDNLRNQVIPTAAGTSGAQLYVGGVTAVQTDFSEAITDRLPLFLFTVVAISFLLLVLVFRSILIPLTAAVMNLLAAAAMFGVLVAVFQWGWFGIADTGPIEPYIPVFLFAGLFGLSMDYEVFLVSRIQEEYHRRGDTVEATVNGLAATGRTITAAALIMALVFVSFVTTGERVVQESGLGLTVAVLLDAVIIRIALVPAVMTIFGKANWWLPEWVNRILPRLDVEGTGHSHRLEDPELPTGPFDWFKATTDEDQPKELPAASSR
ncbi:MMPL family transporter [Actinokineospora pegani]|uniref:MMPL family transporter n=1 Tax=Actinokineospora pegani TaxID=2654637 RepID=UPI0012EA0713|nr:MMPL family transporter [Actinokineospora pegani]